MKTRTLLTVLISCIFMSGVQAQKKNEQSTKLDAAYKTESEALRKFVWSWKDPKFKVREIPTKYAGASRVIIAHHTEFNAERKSKLVFEGLDLARQHNQNVSEIVRQVVKLNDKSAVDEFSELSYTQFERNTGFRKGDVSKVMVGVRVIKPDGRIKEVDVDEVVLTQNNETEKKAKLAIPDLAVGDIIDYYVAVNSKIIDDVKPREYSLFVFGDAPVLNFSFHGVLGKKYGVQYRLYNNAGKLKLSTDAEEDNVIEYSAKDMPPFESTLWIAIPRQLPFVRMMISVNPPRSQMGVQELKSNVAVTEELSLMAKQIRLVALSDAATRYEYKGYLNSAKDAAEKDGTRFKDLSDKDKAAYLFYTIRYKKLLRNYESGFLDLVNEPYQEYNGLSVPLMILFYNGDLKPKLIASEDRTGYRFKEAMTMSDLKITTYLPSISSYFYIRSIFDLPFEAPEEIEGLEETRMFDLSMWENESKGPSVPVNKSTVNAHLEKYQMKVQLDNLAVLAKRSTTVKGYYRRSLQRELILFEDFEASESAAMGLKYSLIESLGRQKNGKQKQEELRNAFAEARKQQQEAFLQDSKDWLGLDIRDMKDAKVVNMGIRHNKPDFVYHSAFTIDGMIKKAGNNYIVEVGKILGEPLKVKDDQRNRTLDVYAPFARSVEQEIFIDIPEGYSVEGLNALNVSVKNETGFFTAEAALSGTQVKILVKKHYLRNFEPAANFSKLNEFMDAASSWTGSKLLFKKK